jgi:hypothetical protein
LVNSLSGAYNRSATVTGFDLNLAPSLNVDYNGVTQTNSTNDLSAVSTSILGHNILGLTYLGNYLTR